MSNLIAFADGASKGNPGPAAIGGVIFSGSVPDLTAYKAEPNHLHAISEFIGTATNNVAEYRAVLRLLEWIRDNGHFGVKIFLDSELVVKQLNGIYKVKSEGLRSYYEETKILLSQTKSTVAHVYREKNAIADYLANQAIRG